VRFSTATLVALVALAPGCNAQRQNDKQPVSPYLFQWEARTECDPIPTGTRAYLSAVPSTPINLHRSDEFVFTRKELPALTLNVQPSMTFITGKKGDDFSVRLCAQAGSQTAAEANHVLDQIKLSSASGQLTLVSPQSSRDARADTDLRIEAPADVPVTVNGSYAALSVRAISAAVKLRTTHARITILDTTGDVDAEANEFGIVDFSGTRGHVRLNAPHRNQCQDAITTFRRKSRSDV
jgi:hypothetical protein